jgi:hypothetical protein
VYLESQHFTVWRIRHPGECNLPWPISWQSRSSHTCKATWIASRIEEHIVGVYLESRKRFVTLANAICLRLANGNPRHVEQICESQICWHAGHSQMATPERRANLRFLLAGWYVEQICESQICWQAGASSRFANRTFAGNPGASSRFAKCNVEQSCAFLRFRFRGDHAHATPANQRGMHHRIHEHRLVCT